MLQSGSSVKQWRAARANWLPLCCTAAAHLNAAAAYLSISPSDTALVVPTRVMFLTAARVATRESQNALIHLSACGRIPFGIVSKF